MAQYVSNQIKGKGGYIVRTLLTTWVFCYGIIQWGFAQPTYEYGEQGSVVEVAGGPAILKKPPHYDAYSPCMVVFENYTHVPLQISRIRKDGKLEKLYYIDQKDTVSFEVLTNEHLVAVHNGYTAGPMFIPYGDINICKIHDAYFNQTQRINPKKYVDADDGYIDQKFKYKLPSVTYGKGKGPVIYFDEAHLNRYRISDRFNSLAGMLAKDGYQVLPYRINFTEKGLQTGKIMVMANAVGQQVNGWQVDSSQALTQSETEALVNWVRNGGRLLLIADGVPYPSRVSQVASAFGFELINTQVLDTTTSSSGSVFAKELGTMAKKHAILEGRNDREIIDQVAAFTGCAFKVPEKAKPLLTYNSNYEACFPKRPWEITEATPKKSADGLSLAATLDVGEGKVVLIGDIEMFSSLKDKARGEKVGMNWKFASQNPRFVLNVFHWLDGFIE